jgi:large subunit ribosomal protein L4
MVQLALRSALSDRASENRVAVVESWDFPAPRTKDARVALDALGLTGRVLIVLDRSEENVEKSFRNLQAVQTILASELNAYDVLCCDWIVFTRSNLPGDHVESGDAGATESEAPAATAPAPAPAAEAPAPEAPPTTTPTAPSPSTPSAADFERVVRDDDA